MARVPVRATYVEIPVHDIDRAERFYRELFGASTRRLEIDGHPCVLLDEDDAIAGAVIALMHGDSYVPSLDGTRVYVTVDDVDATLQRAGELGGATLYPPTEVAEGVTVAELADWEGNRLAISNS